MAYILRLIPHILFVFIALIATAWAATAMWFNLDQAPLWIALGLLALALCATLAAWFHQRRRGVIVLGVATLAVLGWYQTIQPRQDRLWANDVAHGVRAQISRDQVTLSNLRDFDWQDKNTANERWINRSYDLSKLQSLDMITSVWGNPDIAHLLVSFGFADGEHVVFSVEIRREEGEAFNEIGGFFRQFELVLIGATERDIVRLRTDHRGEEVRLFPINLTAQQRRDMFMSYVTLAQRLEQKPQFYNTISANCTTVVYGLARTLKSDLPLRSSLILSGRLPDYLQELGVLGGSGPLQTRTQGQLIPAQALQSHPDLNYSAAIRAD